MWACYIGALCVFCIGRTVLWCFSISLFRFILILKPAQHDVVAMVDACDFLEVYALLFSYARTCRAALDSAEELPGTRLTVTPWFLTRALMSCVWLGVRYVEYQARHKKMIAIIQMQTARTSSPTPSIKVASSVTMICKFASLRYWLSRALFWRA